MSKDQGRPDNRKKRYQDYVILDGEFIGKFEEMYKNTKEVPWHQDETVNAIFSDITITILKRLNISSLLDFGCGLGYMADRCRNEITSLERIVGMDVSQSAIEAARLKFDGVEFITGDLATLASCGEKFEVVMSKDVLWYVLENLSDFIETISSKTSKWLYIGQSFPEKRPFYGDEIFPDAQSLIKYFVEIGYKVQYSIVERDAEYGLREYAHILIEVANDK